MKKSILALFLALCMVITLLPATALADGDTWAEAADTSWYDANSSSYTITTAEQLAGLAKLVNGGNDFSGKTITLGANIDLAGKEWTPIGQSGKAFKGTFVGTGFTVSNVSINDDKLDFAGLFGLMAAPGKLQNVTINNADITAKSSAGVLAGSAYTGTVEGCKVTGLIHVTAYYKVGGMAGEGYADFINCSVIASAGSTVTGVYKEPDLEGDNVGGLIGYRGEGNGVETTNCSVSGVSVTGTRKVAGLIGSAFTDNQIEGCTVADVAVSSNATEEYISANISSAGIGGIVGVYTVNGDSDGTLNECKVENVSLSSENPEVSMGYLTGGMRGKDEIEDLPTSENWSQSDNQITGDNSGGNTGCILTDGEYYNTFAEALNAASDGSTITIAGEIEGNVTINKNIKNLTVEGVPGGVIKNGSLTVPTNGIQLPGLTIKNLTFENANILMTPNANSDLSNLTIAGNTFRGAVKNSAIHLNLGSLTGGTTGAGWSGLKISGNTITNIADGKNSGILIIGDGSTANKLTIENNTIDGVGWNGIQLNQVVGSEISVVHNTLKNCGADAPDGVLNFYQTKAESFNVTENEIYPKEGQIYVSNVYDYINLSRNYWGTSTPDFEKYIGYMDGEEASVTVEPYYVAETMREQDLSNYVPPYTVTIVYNNGAENEVSHHEFGDIITLPTPTNSGYIFLGWRSGDTTYKAGDEVYITSDTTFTAVWGNLPDVKPSEPSEPETPVFPFYDVTVRDWYYNAVKYVYEKGLMDGVDVGVFAPNDTLTRAMVWTIIARAEGVDTTGGATWYAKAQEWVTAKGISDGENPNAAITRQELVTMLYRLAGEPAVSGTITAPDAASVSTWATDAMTWAMNIGLVEGDENGAVTPTATATRAQAAALIMRYLEA
jgi:hypothetical protein